MAYALDPLKSGQPELDGAGPTPNGSAREHGGPSPHFSEPFLVIQNYLSDPESVREYLMKLEYTQKRQGRGISKEYGADLPGPGEEDYSASFGRAYNAHLDVVRRELETDFPGCQIDLRAHRMGPGDHFRCHTDEQVGKRGFTITLSKNWKWDWGGLLMVMEEGGPKPYLPRFNELVMIEGQAHWVTEVSRWAKEPRWTIVGFV